MRVYLTAGVGYTPAVNPAVFLSLLWYKMEREGQPALTELCPKFGGDRYQTWV